MAPAKWLKPPAGVIKINVDAAWSKDGVGIGVLARGNEGFILGGRLCFTVGIINCIWAEVEVVRLGINRAQEQDLNKFIIEGDCANAINKINSAKEDITTLGLFVKGLKNIVQQLNSVKFQWCARSINNVANALSCLALRNGCDSIFNMDFPTEIHNFVISDSYE